MKSFVCLVPTPRIRVKVGSTVAVTTQIVHSSTYAKIFYKVYIHCTLLLIYSESEHMKL